MCPRWLASPALAAALLVAVPVRAASPHEVTVQIRGPLALVTVERALPPDPDSGLQERVLDLDLPEGAALVSVHALPGPRRLAAVPGPAAPYAAAAAALGLAAATKGPEQGVEARLRVASRAADLRIRYRYAAPLACRAGRFFVRIPGAVEADPVPPEVALTIAPGTAIRDLEVIGVRAGRGRSSMRLRGPARAAWEVSFAAAGAATGLAAVSPAGAALGVCTGAAGAERTLPAQLVLAIDRSRSVGLAGVGPQRELARALVEGLPPSLRFNAVLFDRVAAPLFPLSRQATGEALQALERAVTPDQLRNGTDLPAALARAAVMAEQAGGAPAWLAVITDGAVPDHTDAAMLAAAADRLPAHARIAVLVVRPRGDEPPTPRSLAALRALPARRGGVLRVLEPADLEQAVPEIIAAMAGGGDLFAIGPGGGGGLTIAQVLPGGGETRVAAGPFPSGLRARRAGRDVALGLRPVPIERGWLTPLMATGGSPLPWVAASAGDALLVEAGPGVTPGARDDTVRGQMDRSVVRNALSLAFLPRARACYLTRPVRKPEDVELRGRVRLELHLERGELVDARVVSSTLARPDIEACVRDAAYDIETPRPHHRDAPTVAALNLVFQPRTAGGQPADASLLSREIDLLLGPVTFDPAQLLGK